MTIATMPSVYESRDTLHAIEIALDKERMKTIFASRMKQWFGSNLQVKNVHLEVLQRHTYRCVLRYQISAFDSDPAREIQWRVIGKVLKAELGEKLFDNMRELWKNGFARQAEDGISIPEPLEFLASPSMLLQEEIPGLPVKVLLKQSAQHAHFRQLARTLAKLHKCPIIPNRVFSIREHLLRCHPSHEFLALACPEMAPSIDYLVERAYEIESALGDIELAPVHGDFHLGQVHLENGHAWLIDFDVLSYGDPASDLGNLLVFLKSKAKINPELNEIIQTFLDEYFSLMDRKIATRIPLYEGLSYLRRACKCFRLQGEGWRKQAQQLIEQGVAAIETMASYCWLADSQPYLVDDAEGHLI